MLMYVDQQPKHKQKVSAPRSHNLENQPLLETPNSLNPNQAPQFSYSSWVHYKLKMNLTSMQSLTWVQSVFGHHPWFLRKKWVKPRANKGEKKKQLVLRIA